MAAHRPKIGGRQLSSFVIASAELRSEQPNHFLFAEMVTTRSTTAKIAAKMKAILANDFNPKTASTNAKPAKMALL